MTPTRFELADGTVLTVTWDDGEESTFTASQLRAACRCAGCREPSGEAATAAVLAGDVPVSITDARLVGNYAIAFVFAPDGHATGIYPYSVLRELGESSAERPRA